MRSQPKDFRKIRDCGHDHGPGHWRTGPNFNDNYYGYGRNKKPGAEAEAGGPRTFRFFTRLPPEIRLAIWQCHLRRRRIIQLELARAGRGEERPEPYTTRNELGRTVSGDEYHAFLHSYPPRCKLLEVCHEAREAALAFLRVRLPCHTRSQLSRRRGDGAGRPRSVVYLNPEWDYFFVTRYGSGRFLANFFHDVAAHDPRGHGVRHLVLRLPMMGGIVPRDVCEAAWPAFVETLEKLESFWVDFSAEIDWTESGPVMARVGARQPPANRSLPVLCSNTAFDLLPHDPRPIEADLRHMYHTLDTHRHGAWWRQLVEQFGIARPRGPPDMRVLVAESAAGPIADRATFHAYLAPENQYWKLQRDEAEVAHVAATAVNGRHGPWVAKVLRVPKAAGFWLFPPDAFPEGAGRFRDVRDDGIPEIIVDVSDYRPMLCVQDLGHT